MWVPHDRHHIALLSRSAGLITVGMQPCLPHVFLHEEFLDLVPEYLWDMTHSRPKIRQVLLRFAFSKMFESHAPDLCGKKDLWRHNRKTRGSSRCTLAEHSVLLSVRRMGRWSSGYGTDRLVQMWWHSSSTRGHGWSKILHQCPLSLSR